MLDFDLLSWRAGQSGGWSTGLGIRQHEVDAKLQSWPAESLQGTRVLFHALFLPPVLHLSCCFEWGCRNHLPLQASMGPSRG